MNNKIFTNTIFCITHIYKFAITSMTPPLAFNGIYNVNYKFILEIGSYCKHSDANNILDDSASFKMNFRST